MAAELTVSISGNFTRATVPLVNELFGVFGSTLTIVGNNFIAGTQNIGTSNETLPLGDVSTDIGAVWIKNNDATNYVTAGADSTNQPIRVKAGMQSFTGWNGSSVNVKANTAACNIQFIIVQN